VAVEGITPDAKAADPCQPVAVAAITPDAKAADPCQPVAVAATKSCGSVPGNFERGCYPASEVILVV
jgi:hypothetical protein